MLNGKLDMKPNVRRIIYEVRLANFFLSFYFTRNYVI